MAKRGFKGIWIKKDLWLDPDLDILERAMISEIDSLDNGDGCWASNGHFAELFRRSKKHISRVIGNLVKKGRIISTVDYSRGKKRALKRCQSPIRMDADTPIRMDADTLYASMRTPIRTGADSLYIEEVPKRIQEREAHSRSYEQKAKESYDKALFICKEYLPLEFFAWFERIVLKRWDKYLVNDELLKDWYEQIWPVKKYVTRAVKKHRADCPANQWTPDLSKVLKIARTLRNQDKDKRVRDAVARQKQQSQAQNRQQGKAPPIDKMSHDECCEAYRNGNGFIRNLIRRRRPKIAIAVDKKREAK